MANSDLEEVHSFSGCDGSRTPPDVQYEIMRRHKMDIPPTRIAEEVHCGLPTVKAVIANWGNAHHRLRLESHKADLVDHVLTSWAQAAKRGKADSLKAWTDSLGITEHRSASAPQVAVQINLHGGPEPMTPPPVVVQVIEQGQAAETGRNIPTSDNASYVNSQTSENAGLSRVSD
jgi:hypothetical protein